jgi:MoaA/NifB/PqqE/SkfB family radical SAM enzyme
MHADIKVGYSCNNNCIHCIIKPIKDSLLAQNKKIDSSYEELVQIINKSKESGYKSAVLTGGEISIRNDFLKIIKICLDSFKHITIQTNGRLLHKENLIDYLNTFEKQQLTFVVAVHGHNAEIHDSVTQCEGSYKETLKSIKQLIDNKFDVVAKLVISKNNVQSIYDTVFLLKKLGINCICIAFPHAIRFSKETFYKTIPKYSDIKDELHKIYNSHIVSSMEINWETTPYCIYHDKQFWFSNYDLHNKIKQQSQNELPVVIESPLSKKSCSTNWSEERKRIKNKPQCCSKCLMNMYCEGPWEEYTENYGQNEFLPITHDKLVTELLEYYAS